MAKKAFIEKKKKQRVLGSLDNPTVENQELVRLHRGIICKKVLWCAPWLSGPGSPASFLSLGVNINCSKNSPQSNSWHIKPQLSAHIFTYFIKLPFGCFWSSKTAKGKKKVSDTFFVFLRCENVVFKRCFSSMKHMTK